MLYLARNWKLSIWLLFGIKYSFQRKKMPNFLKQHTHRNWKLSIVFFLFCFNLGFFHQIMFSYAKSWWDYNDSVYLVFHNLLKIVWISYKFLLVFMFWFFIAGLECSYVNWIIQVCIFCYIYFIGDTSNSYALIL